MKIHILSRSQWSEPHRIRQQLAELLSKKYDVNYYAPFASIGVVKESVPNVEFKSIIFIEKYASIPFVNIINAILIYIRLAIKINRGDVVINFLPELLFVPKRAGINLISFINDDFASMAPKYSAWWVAILLKRMASRSDSTLYVSSKLKDKYPSKIAVVFYPWADYAKCSSVSVKKDIILYWGYISIAFDFDALEVMARNIKDECLDYNIWLVGPIEGHIKSHCERIVNKYDCIHYFGPMDISKVPTNRVKFGFELLSDKFLNGGMVEFPNKAPRLLAYSIPLVYSGCDLLDEPFFIRNKPILSDLIRYIDFNRIDIDNSIISYFKDNSSSARLDTLVSLISH